jgi:hypothetical protein
MDFGMIAALSAAIGVIIAILAVIRQSNDTHITLGVQLLHDLNKHFDSEKMRQYRRDIAKLCIKREKGAKIVSTKICTQAADVMNFFCAVGMFLKRKILDLEFTYALFSSFVIVYWEILEKDVYEVRKLTNDNSNWEEFEYLYKQMKKYERKFKKPLGKVSEDLIQLFLKAELLP